GFTAYKSDTQELDFKGSMAYIHQNFYDSALNKSLVGSTFAEIYTQKFPHSIALNEEISVTPAWNDTNAWSGYGLVALTIPAYHRLGFTLSALDTYLNNPPPAFKKNSFQFTTGISYTLGH
ncbi:MAG: DUF481 domain-containing protein, partial [Acidobacteriaceae bacterium]|nr:DUF481 domain-containing protein [Acidobacteriaceae bacterium]